MQGTTSTIYIDRKSIRLKRNWEEYFKDMADYRRTSKEIVREWCEKNLSTHSDWTGTRVETKHKCESVEEFVEKLYAYIDDNSWRVE